MTGKGPKCYVCNERVNSCEAVGRFGVRCCECYKWVHKDCTLHTAGVTGRLERICRLCKTEKEILG